MRSLPFQLTKQRPPPQIQAKCNSFAIDAEADPVCVAAFDAEAAPFSAVAGDHGCTWAVAVLNATVRLVYGGSMVATGGVTLDQSANITGVIIDGSPESIIENIENIADGATEDIAIVIIEVGGDL